MLCPEIFLINLSHILYKIITIKKSLIDKSWDDFFQKRLKLKFVFFIIHSILAEVLLRIIILNWFIMF